MRFLGVVLLAVLATGLAKNCPSKKSTSKLFCYYSKITDLDDCYCTHAILPANSDVKAIDRAKEHLKGVKILVTVHEFNQGLVDLLKKSKVDGLEINLKKLDSKNDINDFISTVRSKLGSDLYLALSVPPKADVLAKYFDFKGLSKQADMFILQTAFLGASRNVTFHPSRLSGLWDMQNTDSVIDLVSGLGAPLSKLAIAAPVQAFHFTLQDEAYTAPGSPALEVKSLTRNQLCSLMNGGANWTLERDEDQAGPYIFSKNRWIAFEDSTSMDIKAKYSRVRGLAGLALKDVSQDGGSDCGPSILEAAYNGLSRQARAPRGAVLHSLEREILETARPLDKVQVSPYRISRVIDVEGKVHVIRQDTRTEFECSRQGYFVHPRSCNRFYRCVKFDQLTDEFSVFEFDCPAGLAFDERVEVCVWPGSLSHGTPCSGSSEIAPVPRQRFICPSEPGYYADPENCRWFFACLDHGKSPLSAYEFRCPFGLFFDSERLLCEWPWLVPKCASGEALGINLASEFVYGGYPGNGIALEQYDGLGTLGVVKLGGVAGKVAQPIARVYSNVGTAGLGYQNGGYVNQNGYIVGNGLGSLSLQAAQSLQNAGLLRGSDGLGTSHIYNANGAALAGLDGSNVKYAVGTAGLQGNIHGLQLNYAGVGTSGSSGVGVADAANLNLAGGYGARTTPVIGLGAANIAGANAGQYDVDSNLDYRPGSIGDDFGIRIAQGQSGLNTGVSQGGYNVLHQANLGNNLDYSSNIANAFGAKGSQFAVTGLGSGQQGLNAGLYQRGFGLGIADANDFGAKSSQSFVQGGGNYVSGSGATSTQDIIQYNGQSILDNSGLNQGGLVDSNVRGNTEYNAAGVDGFGTRFVPHGFVKQPDQIDQIAVDNIGLNQVGQNIEYQANLGSDLGNAFETKASQGVTQYNVGSDSQQGVAGNINIVGGGYSAVGASKSGVEISNNGANIDAIVHTTPSPIAITTFSSVPTVTSVPIPALKTASGFESYKGGVIANIPELQYKVYGNASSNFIKFISTTPSTVLVNEGYEYNKPSIPFVEQRNYQSEGRRPQQSSGGATSYSYQSLDTSVGNGGYVYEKPSIAFEEGQQDVLNQGGIASYNVIGSSTIKPAVAIAEQNIVVPSSSVQQTAGYIYSKPSIAFEETPIKTVSSFSISTPTVTPVPVTKQTLQPIIPVSVQSVVPVQPVKSIVSIQPTVSNSFAFQSQNGVSKDQAVVFGARQPQVGIPLYNEISTPRPFIVEQQPRVIVSSTVAPLQPVIPVKPVVSVQPTVSNSFTFQRQDAVSKDQAVVFGARQPQVAISSYNEVSTPRPFIVEQRPQVIVSSTVAPIVAQKVVQPAVSSYSFTQHFSPQATPFEVKPSVQTVQTPAVVSQFSISPAVQPAVASVKEIQPVAVQQPVVQKTVVQPTLATYSYQQEFNGYEYPTPSVTFEEKPAIASSYNYQQPTQKTVVENYVASQPIQPAVTRYTYQNIAQKAVGVQPTASYTYISPSTPKPAILVQQPVVSTYITPSTVKPAVLVQKQPAVISSFSFTAPTTGKPVAQNIEFGGYDYPKPAVAFEETPVSVVTNYAERQPVEEVPFVKTKTYVTGQRLNVYSTARTPVVVENYEAPALIEPYRKVNAYSQSVDTSSAYYINNVNVGSSTPAYQQEYYSTPVYQQPVNQVYVQTTPRPTYQSTVAAVVAAKTPTVTESPNFYYYDSRLSPTPKETVGYSYPKPNVVFEERPIQPVVSTTYLPTAAPTREYLPAQTVTTSRPIYRYSFSALDNQYQHVSTPSPVVVSSTTPLSRGYVPVKTQIQVTTPEPVFVVPEVSTVSYEPVRAKVRYSTTSRPIEVVTPTREYLPARSRVRVTTGVPVVIPSTVTPTPIEVTTLSRDYLPVRSGVGVTTTGISVGEAFSGLEVNSRRPAKVTIIKQNDFHPLLAAKLGAQCTCLSNSLTLGKKKKIIIVEDDDDDDGYVVANNNQGGAVVENYQYNPQDTVDITPTPQIYLKSTTNEIVPAPAPPYVRQRIRVRPVTSTIAYQAVTETVQPRERVSDAEIANAVKTGLNLVKEAAREGAKEGTEEIISKYGPGTGNVNVRGTIECERAGLFRHPSQCNKFYACRWDCNKNKFTVHTFNCPIHLTFDSSLGACNWPSQGPACLENTLLPSE